MSSNATRFIVTGLASLWLLAATVHAGDCTCQRPFLTADGMIDVARYYDCAGPCAIDNPFQTAIYDAVEYRIHALWLRPRVNNYPLSQPIRFRGRQCEPAHGLMIRGAGERCMVMCGFNAATEPMFDLTGCRGCSLQDFAIVCTPKSGLAACGVLLARHSDCASSSSHRLQNISINGSYELAAVAMIGSEVNSFIACRFENNRAGGPKYALYTSADRPPQLAPTNCAGACTYQTNQQNDFTNCTFALAAHHPDDAAVYLATGANTVTTDFRFVGGGISIYGDTGVARAAFRVRVDSIMRNIKIDSMRMELTHALHAVFMERTFADEGEVFKGLQEFTFTNNSVSTQREALNLTQVNGMDMRMNSLVVWNCGQSWTTPTQHPQPEFGLRAAVVARQLNNVHIDLATAGVASAQCNAPPNYNRALIVTADPGGPALGWAYSCQFRVACSSELDLHSAWQEGVEVKGLSNRGDCSFSFRCASPNVVQ
jgi:hypothetical protein